ncbi:hypothetical protein LX99_04590 [Mucilaginibacter oryzae]|uniref:Uncharacterized protein n=1 Tax=Mucilaginibacter oryzae TaxID=468058 RepID=A0A316H1S7_9SPHI|nr:hypothetical protein [Mucilaginibacter oryzae]PWK70882.1 hypothetical protein LX99_04590 [Mucilaginibacter oryzae]
MSEKTKIKRIDKLSTALYFYLFLIVGVIFGGAFSPTNLAGPGVDMLFLLVLLIGIVFFLYRSVLNLSRHGKAFLPNLVLSVFVLLVLIGLCAI